MPIDKKEVKSPGVSAPAKAPKKYRDRPADEGKHGDAADEPNSGLPNTPKGPTGGATAN
jgi:hypothetical protein